MRISMSVLAAVAVLGATPAVAQPRWAGESGYVQGLSTRVLMRLVRSQGLRPVGRGRLRDRLYTVPAVDAYGAPRQVVIDAVSARVVRVQAAHPGGAHGRDYAMRPPAPVRGEPRGEEMEDYYDMNGAPPGAPVPPRGMSDEGAPHQPLPPLRPRASLSTEPPSAAPQATLPPPPRVKPRMVKPAKPPLPRPRPADQASVAPSAPPEAVAPPPAPAAATQPAAEPAASTPAPAPAAEPSASAPAAAAPASHPRPLPRVVLPGGPLPKAERTAATTPGHSTPEAAPPVQDKAPDKPAEQTMEKPALPPDASAIPPAQTYE